MCSVKDLRDCFVFAFHCFVFSLSCNPGRLLRRHVLPRFDHQSSCVSEIFTCATVIPVLKAQCMHFDCRCLFLFLTQPIPSFEPFVFVCVICRPSKKIMTKENCYPLIHFSNNRIILRLYLSQFNENLEVNRAFSVVLMLCQRG